MVYCLDAGFVVDSDGLSDEKVFLVYWIGDLTNKAHKYNYINLFPLILVLSRMDVVVLPTGKIIYSLIYTT